LAADINVEELVVKYAPRIFIMDMVSHEMSSNSMLEIEKSVGIHGGSYGCFSKEHPNPPFEWRGPNGQILPNGVSQIIERSMVVLQWTRSLEEGDTGVYQCSHKDEAEKSSAFLNLEVVG